MIRICAWCGKDMGENDIEPKKAVTHGMCQDCLKKELASYRKSRHEKSFTNETYPPEVSLTKMTTQKTYF